MTTGRYPWHRAHAPLALAALVAALIAAVTPMCVAAEPVACAPTERTLFSCRTGSKQVAVCASPELAETGGVVQYRFGRPGAAELVYPAMGADWRTVTRSGGLMFSGGGGAFLAFTNERYRYVVYSAVGRGWGSRAGVVVEQAGKRIASLACRGAVTSDLGPNLFSAAGIESAEGSFDLP